MEVESLRREVTQLKTEKAALNVKSKQIGFGSSEDYLFNFYYIRIANRKVNKKNRMSK